MSADLKDYLCEETASVMALEYGQAFDSLTEREKMYTYYLFKAIAAGWRITAIQVSKESPYIISLLIRIFRDERADELKDRLVKENILSEKDVESFLIYCYNVLGNMGNYRGFGDTKILPRCDLTTFEKVVKNSKAYNKEMEDLWNQCSEKIFSHNPNELRLGLGESGCSSYYSENITMEDIKIVQSYCDENGIENYNNRLFKHNNGDLELRMASSKEVEVKKVFYQERTILITSGDYSPILNVVVEYLRKAMEYTSNDTQKAYLEYYIKSFEYGDLNDHIEGSGLWTKDKKPIVENYIGFIENYRDPYGVRGEWEGFVAIMNKKYTQILSNLVDQAPVLLQLLPWGKNFENPVFLKPDFTSIDIVGFFGSGLPAGINIPNYDCVRQSIGFKNVSLGNVINGKKPRSDKANFIRDEDQDLFKRESEAFEVQVGLHELLGHGSGLLFTESRNDLNEIVTNFASDLEHPILGGKITSWYKEGETWSGVFSSLANTYEECRAECVGLYLSTFPEVLKIFGYEGKDYEEMMYLNWLHQIQMSFASLQAYNTIHQTWTQSHCCARHVYLQVLLKNTKNLLSIKPIYNESNEMVDFCIHLNRDYILSEGRPAIGKFLMTLQVFKSTADVENGTKFFNQFVNVDETFLQYRSIVLNKKKPRAVFMQPNLILENGVVKSVAYDTTASGVVDATVAILGDLISEEDFLRCIYRNFPVCLTNKILCHIIQDQGIHRQHTR